MQKEDNTFDFHSKLEKIARKADFEGSGLLFTIWHDFLEHLLHQWNADIKIDLHHTTIIMLECAGYCVGDGISTIPSISDNFWFKWSPTQRENHMGLL